MIKYILQITISIMISFSFSNTIISMNGNMDQFSSMNSGSFIESNYREFNNTTYNLYNMSFIKLPADITFHEIFFQKSMNQYLISSKISILNYGNLEDVLNNSFSANNRMLQISIFNIQSKSFIYGMSIGLIQSSIETYSSSALVYNFGFNKSYFNNKLIVGLSVENFNTIIDNYSNLEDSIPHIINVSSIYKPQFIPFNLRINYLYDSLNNQELGLSLIGHIDNIFYFYTGKYFYINDVIVYNVFENIAFGCGIFINNQYKINLGLQHLANGIFNIGTSLTAITLDNF